MKCALQTKIKKNIYSGKRKENDFISGSSLNIFTDFMDNNNKKKVLEK